MPRTEAQRRAQNKYDATHYGCITAKIPLQEAAYYKRYCLINGTSASADLRQYIRLCIKGMSEEEKRIALFDAEKNE